MRKWKSTRNKLSEAAMLRFICMRFFAMGCAVGAIVTYALVSALRIAKALGY